jgi:hypothetical protein
MQSVRSFYANEGKVEEAHPQLSLQPNKVTKMVLHSMDPRGGPPSVTRA